MKSFGTMIFIMGMAVFLIVSIITMRPVRDFIKFQNTGDNKKLRREVACLFISLFACASGVLIIIFAQ